jgi:hypothetical protein
MREVSDAFLLLMAEVSATLIGLFLVGMLFFAETGFRRLERVRGMLEPYFRASTRIVLLLFALPLGLSLTLVVLEPIWNRLLFAVFCVLLLAANTECIVRIRPLARLTGSTTLVVNEVLGTLGVLTLVVTPWALGGFQPSREDLTWALLLSFATGFISLGTTVLSIFDTVGYEATTAKAR